MTVWGISDLHLALGVAPDVRRRSGAVDHSSRVERQWRAIVAPEDLVLMPGDLSIARDHREIQPDLEWLQRLPGRKVLSPGNHDRWWNRVEAVRRLLRPGSFAVDGDAITLDGMILCGCLGSPVGSIDQPDPPIPLALERTLASAATLARPGWPIILLWHFPPFASGSRPGPWVARFRQAGLSACLYGHGHREAQWSGAVQGLRDGVRYHGVSADSIGFRPYRIDLPQPL